MRSEGARLSHVANGQVATDAKAPMAARLHHLHDAIAAVIGQYAPDRAAVEDVFVNKNPQSTLKLAQARGAVLAACGRASLPVAEHAAVEADEPFHLVADPHESAGWHEPVVLRPEPSFDDVRPMTRQAFTLRRIRVHRFAQKAVFEIGALQ